MAVFFPIFTIKLRVRNTNKKIEANYDKTLHITFTKKKNITHNQNEYEILKT